METLLAYLSSFRHLSEDERNLISLCFSFKLYKEGEYLFKGGKVCNEFFFISSGITRIIAINDKGVEITYFFIGEKQFCTILDSFTDGTIAKNSIQACCITDVLVINKKRLIELYEKLPLMSNLFYQINQQRLLEKIRLKNIYSGEDSVSRYKMFLQEQPEIAHRVPLNYVASYLNVTPQSLSRIRKILK